LKKNYICNVYYPIDTHTMDTTYLSEIKKSLSSDMEFEFSLDFQGQVEYVESENTDQFFIYESVLLFLVEKDLIPINERTEGIVTIKMGIVYLDYKTCTQVGEDWNDDVWEEETSEHLVLNLLGE
jgi:ABC-type molybdate transport system substrate-binding protein